MSKKLKLFSVLISLITSIICYSGMAYSASERHALIIANTKYGGKDELFNPSLDAAAIAVRLRALGYKLYNNDVQSNLEIDGLSQLITRFFNSIPDGSSTFIYYAGHGVSVDGLNFLVPILPSGVSLKTETDIKNRTYPLRNLVTEANYQNPTGVNVVLVDACRDAPIEKDLYRSVNLLDGMSKIETPPEGTFVGFSAEYGKKALDGNKGEHSPYAKEILFGLEKQASLDIELFHKNVADRVYKNTGGKQYPIYEPRIRGKHCLIQCEESKTLAPQSINYGELSITTEPVGAEVCFMIDGSWKCDLSTRYYPIGTELNLRVRANKYKDSTHKILLTKSNQEFDISLEKKQLSTAAKIGIGVGIALVGALLGSSSSGSGGEGEVNGFPVTLVPPGSQ